MPGMITRAIQPYFKVMNKNLNLSPYIRYVETDDSLDNAAGAFTLRLSFKGRGRDDASAFNMAEDIYRMLDEKDAVDIGCTKPGLMAGVIDGVNKVKEIGTENYSRELEVYGRNFAALLLDDNVEFSPQLSGEPRAVELLGKEKLEFLGTFARGFDGRKSQFLFNSPICAILYGLKNMPSVHIQIPYTDLSGDILHDNVSVTKLGNYFVCDMKAWLGDQVADVSLSQWTGKLWNYLEMCIDKNFYELFVDTVRVDTPSGKETRPCLFLRPKPFDRITDPTQLILNSAQLSGNNTSGNNTVIKNFVIYPSFSRNDIVFKTSKDGVTKYVSIADMDELCMPVENSPRFKGKRDANNPGDASNPSMIIPWTWDGTDSFYRTLITNEPYHVITEGMIKKEHLGISDREVVNYITFSPRKEILAQIPEAELGFLYPMLDAYSIQRFGLRSYHAQSNLIRYDTLTPDQIQSYGLEKSDDQDVVKVSEFIQCRERIFYWYRYNPFFENGSIVIEGNQDIRKGDKVYLRDAKSKRGNTGLFAYVKRVKNQCEITESGSQYYTTLELTRGENKDDIGYYRSQKNKLISLNVKRSGGSLERGNVQTSNPDGGSEKVIMLGTTYETYDNGKGAPFKGDEKFDSDGNSVTPGAHNILKFDFMNVDKKKDSSDKLDNKKLDDLEIAGDNNSNNNSNNKIKGSLRMGYISKDIQNVKSEVFKLFDKGILVYGNDSVKKDLTKGVGKPIDKGDQCKVIDAIYEFLQLAGTSGFPFPIRVTSVISNHKFNAKGGRRSQHSKGEAVDISVAESPGSDKYIEKITLLGSSVLGKPQYKNQPNGVYVDLFTMLSKKGIGLHQVINSPYQDKRDAYYCLNFSSVPDSGHNNHIHVGFD
jgi:hypothetical protein